MLSSTELMGMVADLNLKRIPMVGGERIKRAGGEPPFNKHEVSLMLTARQMHRRYLAGRYEHEQSEERQIVELCYKMIEWHNRNKGLSGRPVPNFTNHPLSTTTPCAKGIYAVVCHKVVNEDFA